MDNLEDDECASVKKLKTLLSKDDVQQQQAFLTSSFKPLCAPITKLEGRVSFTESLGVFEEFIDTFVICCYLEKYNRKLQDVLRKNPDLEPITQIAAIQKGEVVPGFSMGLEMVPKMKFAPVVSVEVERFFSLSRRFLAPHRGSIIHCWTFKVA